MNSVVEDSNTGTDPEAEVRKLQDLVKKLEKQNQILRSKQNQKDDQANVICAQTDIVAKDFGEKLPKSSWNNLKGSEKLKDGLKNVTLEDVEVLDVENVLSEDEEDNWLFSSPRKASPAQENVSPYQWMRSALEHPSPDIKPCRKSLFLKLDEVTRFPRSPSSDTVGSLTSPASTPSAGTHVNLPPEDSSVRAQPSNNVSLPSSGSVPNIRQPLLGLGSRVDTNTFTRPKKPLNKNVHTKAEIPAAADSTDSVTELTANSVSPRGSPRERSPRERSPRESSQRERSPREKSPPESSPRDSSPRQVAAPQEDENANSATSSDDYKLADVVDVQVLARMQEESLRQSFNSPFMSPRKSSLTRSINLNRSTGGLLESVETSGSPQSSNRASPGRYDGDLYQSPACRSNNSLGELSSNSSSPPGSPYGSQFLEHKAQQLIKQDAHRRSLPNLHKSNQLSLASHGSDTRLSSRASPQRQLQAPSQRLARPPGAGPRTASPGRTASPQRSGIPGPRSGIPRPGATSKLPAPRKSSIPSRSPVRRPITTPRTNDDSWKDGCF